MSNEFVIYNWCHKPKVAEVMDSLGYVDCSTYEGNIFEVSQKFYDAGLNVYIKHNGKNHLLALELDQSIRSRWK